MGEDNSDSIKVHSELNSGSSPRPSVCVLATAAIDINTGIRPQYKADTMDGFMKLAIDFVEKVENFISRMQANLDFGFKDKVSRRPGVETDITTRAIYNESTCTLSGHPSFLSPFPLDVESGSPDTWTALLGK